MQEEVMSRHQVKQQIADYLSQTEAFIKQQYGVDLLLKPVYKSPVVTRTPYKEEDWNRLQTLVANYYQTTWEEIVQPGKKEPFCEIRACYYVIGYQLLPYKTMNEIGKLVGGRNGDTVADGLRKFRGFLKINDPKAIAAVQNITGQLRQHIQSI